MKKALPFLIAFFMLTGKNFATGIDANYAMQVAQNFYHQSTGKTAGLTLAYQSLNTSTTNGVAVGTPLYYAFNVSNSKGFVIISADDIIKPVLG